MSIHQPLYYKGQRVWGVKPWTLKQRLKIYWLMGLWTLFFLYIIIIAALGLDPYLIGGQGLLIMMGFLVSMFTTVGWYRKQERKNYILNKEEWLTLIK